MLARNSGTVTNTNVEKTNSTTLTVMRTSSMESLRVFASLADEARAKVNAFYDASEVSDARILLLLLFFVLFSLVLAHFIAARVILNGGFGSKRNTALGGRRSKKRDLIVLCGQDGAGSTSAYLLLKNKSLGLGTVTSMKENESEVEIRATSDTDDAEKITKVNVIDLPGHAKIRKRFYERFLPRAKCIVFFVDGVEFSTNKKDVADHLYHEILIDYENVRRKRIPILIAVPNKMDKTESCSQASASSRSAWNLKSKRYGSRETSCSKMPNSTTAVASRRSAPKRLKRNARES